MILKTGVTTHPLACLLLAVACLLTTGCLTLYKADESITPLVEPGPLFTEASGGVGEKLKAEWWLVFRDEKLSRLIESALKDNFTLKQAYARIKQAAALEVQAGAIMKPDIRGEVSRSTVWGKERRESSNNVLEAALNWEIDLWKKLSSARKASALEHKAAQEMLEDGALLLTSQVADTYFRIIEQTSHLSLLIEQIKVSKTYLKLTELRFKNGDASLVDIFQQRQQLASLSAQLPLVRSQAAALYKRLHVLLGKVPVKKDMDNKTPLPELPALPHTGIPADLLINRPDLRVLHKRVVAADYRVAEAVAKRLPEINIGAATGFRGESLSVESLFFSIFGEITGSIVDHGKDKAEVERRKAIVEEELARYTQTWLTAVEEVENALNLEREQTLFIDALNEQFEIAKANLKETRNRYMRGISDYLPVLTALQSTQKLERDILIAKRELISNRILLYRALGGAGFMKSMPADLNVKGRD